MSLADFTYDPKQKHLRITIVAERLDASVAIGFREELNRQWPQVPPKTVDVDLQTVTFIDSSGIGSLIAISKKLGRQTAPVALHGVLPQVRSVIELLRLQSLFRVL